MTSYIVGQDFSIYKLSKYVEILRVTNYFVVKDKKKNIIIKMLIILAGLRRWQ